MNSAERNFLCLAIFLFALGMVSRLGFLNRLSPLEYVSLPANPEFSEAAAMESDSASLEAGGIADSAKPDGEAWNKKDAKSKKKKPAFPINVNSASKEDLCFIKGIGPATAQKIIEHREKHGDFRKAKDLEKVSGIGAKKRQAMEEFIRFE